MGLKQVIIVNKDLGMRAGKIAAQVAHGEVLYMEDVMMETMKASTEFSIRYSHWRQKDVEPIGVMTKIIKKATYRELLEIMHTLDEEENIKYYPVYDMGKTQIDKGSLTVVCVEPLEEEDMYCKFFGELKLL